MSVLVDCMSVTCCFVFWIVFSVEMIVSEVNMFTRSVISKRSDVVGRKCL